MIFKFIIRVFIKTTGFPIFYIIAKQKKYFSSLKAKQQFKSKKKEGVILVSNHTAVLDYYGFLYLYLFKSIKTFASEILYKNIFMRFLNWAMDNIYINRKSTNLNAISKSEKMLNKHKYILIFPEGHVEKEKGKLEKFYESAVILAFRTHSAIVPHYISGDFSIRKRNRIIIGERIYVNNLLNNKMDLTKEDIEYCLNYIKEEINKLKNKVDNIIAIPTNTFFSKKTWLIDLAKITTIPVRRILWNTKIYYFGSKKEVKNCFKYNCLLSANHKGVVDVFFLYFYFFRRRIRIIASNSVYEKPFFKFCLNNSNAIKYNVDNASFDYYGFKEAMNTLIGNGVVAIYPEGHLNEKENMLKINEGLALLSLSTNSPIIPIYHINQYHYFRRNKVLIGNPIYPNSYLKINKDEINHYNDKIIKAFKDLKKESINYEKRRNIKRTNKTNEGN